MAIANILGNILTDSGVNVSSLVAGSGTTNYVPKFTAGNTLGNSQVFDNGTNVGIGTISPAYKLDVSADIGCVNLFTTGGSNIATNSGSLGVGTSTTNIGTWGKAVTLNSSSVAYELAISNVFQAYFAADATNVYLGSYANKPLLFRTNNADVGRFFANGNFAIGTTTDAGFRLDVNGTARVQSTLTVPGAGTESERFGVSSTAAGNYSVAVGASAQATTAESTAIGRNARTTNGKIAIGKDALASGGSNTIAIGGTASGLQSILLGGGTTSGSRSIVLGTILTTNTYASVLIGDGSVSTADNQIVFGGVYTTFKDLFLGNGVTASSPSSSSINTTGASGTDIAGASLTLSGGKATGNALGGDLIFSTSDATTSGTTLQSLTAKMTIKASGSVGIGTTSPTSNSFLTIQSASAASQLSLVLKGHNTTNAGGFRLLSSDESTVNYSVYADNLGLSFSTTSSTYIQAISFATGQSGFFLGNSSALYVRGAASRDLNLGSNNTNDRVIIKSSTGNLLVGTSTDSGQKFQVSGTSSLGGDVTITTTTSARTLTINKGTSYNSINFQASTSEFSFNDNAAVTIQVGLKTFNHSDRVTFNGYQNSSYIEFKEQSTNTQIFYVKNGDTLQWNWAKNLKIDGGTSASQCATSSILELSSTTKGFLPPRMTAVQAEAISTPAEGLMVYATDGTGVTITSKGWWGWSGATWEKLN